MRSSRWAYRKAVRFDVVRAATQDSDEVVGIHVGRVPELLKQLHEIHREYCLGTFICGRPVTARDQLIDIPHITNVFTLDLRRSAPTELKIRLLYTLNTDDGHRAQLFSQRWALGALFAEYNMHVQILKVVPLPKFLRAVPPLDEVQRVVDVGSFDA